MIRSLINRFVKAALDELFIDTPSVQLSMGADLFSDSNLNLKNLTLRPDLFDVYAQPLRLVSGHIGQLCVEGIAELALGGKLKFQAENIYLLFALDSIADPEKVQTMKKILIELQSSKFSSDMLFELLRRIQGMPTVTEVDLNKKRKVVYKALDYISKGIFITIKNVHIRFEFQNEDGRYDALGCKLPLVKINPGSNAMRPDTMSRHDPLLSIQIKAFQAYCDYRRLSFDQGDAEQTTAYFEKYAKGGLHTSLIIPTDIDIVLGLDIKRRTGLVCPKVILNVTNLRCCVDKDQIEALSRMMEGIVRAKKKFEQAEKVQKIFRSGFPLPRMYQVVGVRCLPHLYVRNEQYPRYITLAKTATQEAGGLVAFMKNRVGHRWPLMLWKHLTRLILHDIRTVRPLGRWAEIVRLNKLRREYVFAYAKLLMRSNSSAADLPQYIFNVNAPISQIKLRDLFEIEMQLSLAAVSIFRSLSYMVAIVTSFQNRAKAAGGAAAGDRIFISWKDILRTFVELFEARRESSFHRFDRSQDSNGSVTEDYDDYLSVNDDSVTTRNSDDGTVYSYSLQTRTPVKTRSAHQLLSTKAPIPTSATTAQAKTSFFGGLSFTSHKDTSNATTPSLDEYDKKFDLSVFGSAFGIFNSKSDRERSSDSADNNSQGLLLSQDMEAMLLKYSAPSGMQFPSLGSIVEAVQWAMQRYQPSLTILPPDLTAKMEKFSIDVKTPLLKVLNSSTGFYENNYQEARMTLFNANAQHMQMTLNISQSSSNDQPRSNKQLSTSIESSRGFDYLSGALIQVKLVVRQCACSLAIPPMIRTVPVLSPARRRTARIPGEHDDNDTAPSSERGSQLTSGLPAYPVDHAGESADQQSEMGDSIQNSLPDSVADNLPPAPSTPTKMNESKEWKSIPGVSNPNIKYIPGKTLLESLQQQEEVEQQNGEEEEEEEEDSIAAMRLKSGSSKKDDVTQSREGYTIESNMEDMNLAAASDVSIYDNIRYVRKEFFSSSPGDQVLIICIILDLDNKGEGAGDVQFHIGSVRLDLSNPVMSALLSPLMLQTVQDLKSNLSTLYSFSALLSEPMVLIDWTTRRPHVQTIYTRIRFHEEHEEEFGSHLDELSYAPPSEVLPMVTIEEDDEEDDDAGSLAQSTSELSQSIEQPSSHPAVTASFQPTASQSKPKLLGEEGEKAFASYQEALLLHRNMAQWLSLFLSYLPKVMSVSFRLSNILIQSLEANILRDLIHARLHSVLDKAAGRSNLVEENFLFGINSMKGLLANLLLASLDPSALGTQMAAGIGSGAGVGRGGNAAAQGSRGSYRAYQAFRSIRKWGVRKNGGDQLNDPDLNHSATATANGAATTSSSASAAKVKVLLPGVDAAFMKSMLPLPSLALHWQQMTVLQVPMSDETLCHYLAFLFAQLSPFYKY
eukprot:gene3454-3783_t